MISGANARISATASSARIRFGCFDPLVAPDRFVRLSHHADQLVLAGIQQPSQNRHADFARPDEEHAHRALKLDAGSWRAATLPPRGHRLRHHFFAGRDFTLAHRGGAAGAEIIVNFLFREDQQKPFAHRHRRLALLAIETRRREILKLLLAHAPRSLRR
jgi:hypothetical protein